jgi:sugar/nucleoside kinase (ribokinase family)
MWFRTELPAEVVVKAMWSAREAGAAVFFDPGPRCWTMTKGPRRASLDAVMDLCDVILMTEVEPSPSPSRFCLYEIILMTGV